MSGRIALLATIGLAMTTVSTIAQPKEQVLRNLHVHKGWHDGSAADLKPTWEALPQEGDQEAGVRLTFPAIARGWFNIFQPVREGSWPQGGERILLRARADRAATILLRLNEMPGAVDGKMDRHEEFEAHVVEFSVGKEWRDVAIGGSIQLGGEVKITIAAK